MIISLHEITIRDLFAGYLDSQEEGVVAYGGRLDVRPKYQREFVYTGKQREEVINTVRHGFPLNIMYWVIHVHLCKKFLLTLFMSCQSPFAKPYLTLKEAEFDK